jgi:hypothetical protein
MKQRLYASWPSRRVLKVTEFTGTRPNVIGVRPSVILQSFTGAGDFTEFAEKLKTIRGPDASQIFECRSEG